MSDATLTILIAGLVQVVGTICATIALWIRAGHTQGLVKKVEEQTNGGLSRARAEIAALKDQLAALPPRLAPGTDRDPQPPETA